MEDRWSEGPEEADFGAITGAQVAVAGGSDRMVWVSR